MTRDSELYHQPDVFNPERFIVTANREAELDPTTFAFGFGRRYVLIVSRGHSDQRLLPNKPDAAQEFTSRIRPSGCP